MANSRRIEINHAALQQVLRFWFTVFALISLISLFLLDPLQTLWVSYEPPLWNTLFLVTQSALWIPALLYRLIPCPKPSGTSTITSRRLLFWAFLNHTLCSTLYGIFFLPTHSSEWTTKKIFCLQFLFYTFLADCLFGLVHWLFHRNLFLYAWIHKHHHEVIHPTALSTFYVHPLEHLLANIVPIFAGPFLWPTDPVVLCLWVGTSVLSAVHNHSGTDLAWWNVDWHHAHHEYGRKHFSISGLFEIIDREEMVRKR